LLQAHRILESVTDYGAVPREMNVLRDARSKVLSFSKVYFLNRFINQNPLLHVGSHLIFSHVFIVIECIRSVQDFCN